VIFLFILLRLIGTVFPAVAPPVNDEPLRNENGEVELWSTTGISWGFFFLNPFIFGYLHRKNWVALGNLKKAQESSLWLYLILLAVSSKGLVELWFASLLSG